MSAPRSAAAAVLSEHDIQTHIMAYLRLAGYYTQRMNVGRKRHDMAGIRPGTPDVWAVKGGRLLCVEVKRPGEVPSDVQLRTMAELRAYGARCIVVCSVEDVQAAL